MPRNHLNIPGSGTVDRWTGQLSVRGHGAWTGVCVVRPPCNSRSPGGPVVNATGRFFAGSLGSARTWYVRPNCDAELTMRRAARAASADLKR